jgi:molybdopterin-guanine dinucleotide biosynthesis protein A
MDGVREPMGWAIDPETLREVVTDPAAIQAQLACAEPVERLFLLRLLGEVDQGLVESATLATDPVIAEDPWRTLLLTADLHRWRGDFAAAERAQSLAWKHTRGSRDRQGTTLQHIGKRQFDQGQLDAAAASFELALTLRRGFAAEHLIASSESALNRTRVLLGYDAIVLAGGRGQRLGGPGKPGIPLAGWPLVDHVLLAVSGAAHRIVVGPPRIGLADPVFCREQPAGSGPAAGIDAGLAQVRQPVVAVLAADLPFIAAALPELRRSVAMDGTDAAVLVDSTGRVNYLASVWRTAALFGALERLGNPANAPVRRLYDGVDVTLLADFDALGADCDTPADLRVADERIRRHTPGQLPVTPLAWPRLALHAPSSAPPDGPPGRAASRRR